LGNIIKFNVPVPSHVMVGANGKGHLRHIVHDHTQNPVSISSSTSTVPWSTQLAAAFYTWCSVSCSRWEHRNVV